VEAQDFRSATFTVVDVETTGFDPVADKVVEIACVRLRHGSIVDRFESLIDPGRPIPERATAVHGILDTDVLGKPKLDEVIPRISGLIEDAVVVAHNARFDVSFLPFVRHRPVICSMRLAMHLVDAHGYGNQALRRELAIDDPELRGLSAHRALADAIVTARIFEKLCAMLSDSTLPKTVDELISAIVQPPPFTRCVCRIDPTALGAGQFHEAQYAV